MVSAAALAAMMLGACTSLGQAATVGAPSTTAEVHVSTPRVSQTPPSALRTWEWRRLDLTPLTRLTEKFPAFAAIGGTTVSLDISYVVDITEIADPGARDAAAQAYRAKLTQYVSKASRSGLRVEAAAGAPHWLNPGVRYTTGIIQQFVSDFNAARPAWQRLTGVHFDLEPWGTDAWSTRAPELTRYLLSTVGEIAAKQKATPAGLRVPVTVDMPFWLDGTTAPAMLNYAGVRTSPTQHVMRLLDNGTGLANTVMIMAYRDTTGGPDGSLAVLAKEFRAAAAHQGRVRVGIGQEIGDVDPSRITFFEEGVTAMLGAMRTLEGAYGKHVAFGGFAVDHLGALSSFL